LYAVVWFILLRCWPYALRHWLLTTGFRLRGHLWNTACSRCAAQALLLRQRCVLLRLLRSHCERLPAVWLRISFRGFWLVTDHLPLPTGFVLVDFTGCLFCFSDNAPCNKQAFSFVYRC